MQDPLDSLTTSYQQPDGSGILLIDKPTGMTSHDVVGHIRRNVGIKCVGHAGTLDPLATGLLIILVGRQYTKLQDTFLKQDKEYECTMELGKTTDTYDSEGTVLASQPWEVVSQITDEQIAAAVAHFVGDQSQTVPVYSAVKVRGRRLYKFARQQQKVVLPVRQVTIHRIDLVSVNRDADSQQLSLTLRLSVSSGTYIRSLAHDLGQFLGVGATVTALRRTAIGHLRVENARQI